MNALTAACILTGLLFLPAAHSLILEPNIETAGLMGYQVLGEVEFQPATVVPRSSEQVRELKEEFLRNCTGSDGRVLLLAWSDREYPAARRRYPPAQVNLARLRATVLNRILGQDSTERPHFETVNMATRRPHLLGPRENIKRILEMSGAAPSDAYLLGLFGEYAQRSKVVVWADCRSRQQPSLRGVVQRVQVASLGQFTTSPR